jgi:hypothetical protein
MGSSAICSAENSMITGPVSASALDPPGHCSDQIAIHL